MREFSPYINAMSEHAENWIPSPCHLNWNNLNAEEPMPQGHNARMCDECEHYVHDLSGMTPTQIITLKHAAEAKGQHLCGKLPTQTPNKKRLRKVTLASLSAMAPIALAACTESSSLPSQNNAQPPIQQPSGSSKKVTPKPPIITPKIVTPNKNTDKGEELAPKRYMAIGLIAEPPPE